MSQPPEESAHSYQPLPPSDADKPDQPKPLPPLPTLLVGGRYQLLEMLGQGAMSQVYRGLDTALNRTVAIKFLREEYGADPGFVARFNREAQAVAGLSGQGILNVYDYGQHEGRYYIVMEYIQGSDLKEVLRREGPLPLPRALAFIRQVLLALKVAHQQGLIHRDVKPQNILVSERDGTIRLADFGIAHAIGATQLTTAGTVLGTAHYMAPEQAQGGQVGPATDIYAVGIVLYEMLTGRLPFDGQSPMEVLMAHLRQPTPTLAEAGLAAAPALERFVARALEKDPARRYQSADQMLHDLTRLEEGEAEPRSVAFEPLVPYVLPSQERTTLAAASAPAHAPRPYERATLVAPLLPPEQVSKPGRKSRAGWLGPLLVGLVVLAGLGWLLLSLLAGRAADGNKTASPTATVVQTSPSPAPAKPFALSFDSKGLQGAYERDDATLYGRLERALYGTGSPFSQGTITFKLDALPTETINLRLTGLDDERTAHCQLEVQLNGQTIFDGPDTLPNAPNGDNGEGGKDRYWGGMSLAVPSGALKLGTNTLILRNKTAWAGYLGIPYILINKIELVSGG